MEKHCCLGWKNDIERGGKTIAEWKIYNAQLRRAVQKQKSYCYAGYCRDYIPRPALEIAGTKWCGKTWCALMHAKRASYVDENLALAVDDPAAMLVGERLHAIDGWQRVPVRHYRDSSGLEADAVIELADGRWAAFEIKTSESKPREGVASLKRLREKLAANPSARARPPEFMAVITGVSEYAHRIEDGIYTVPIRALTA
jgi:hypothetical protein